MLDLGLNMETLEEQMLHELTSTHCPELEVRWQEIKSRILDCHKAVKMAEVFGTPDCGEGLNWGGAQIRECR